jgi:DNA-binding MarR family transcriptional regulator
MHLNAPTVGQAIRQIKPFASKRQEGILALLLASEVVRWRFARVLAGKGDLTFQQYNVLRILRGAGGKGLATLSIVERMIEHTPGITRLIDRLEAKGLVARDRAREDRRQVLCRITPAAIAELKALDPAVTRADQEGLGDLSDKEVASLIRLLNKVRTTQS